MTDWPQDAAVEPGAGEGGGNGRGDVARAAIKLRGRGLSEQGNAERFVAQHGTDVRYCHSTGAWLLWDRRRFAIDRTERVVEKAKQTVAKLYLEAAEAGEGSDRREIVKHARTSESYRQLHAMLGAARSDQAIALLIDELDRDPFLLNVLNGTLDLRTGTLRPHRREDLLTKLVPVVYDAQAAEPTWARFLETATDGDAELAAFLRRAVGYTLTASTNEEVLFFAHGPAATGKTTFLEAVKAMVGDYGATADFESFLKRQREGGPRNDLARLPGARYVVSIEVDEGKQLAEGVLKQFTGGDTIAARFLRQEFFEFQPVAKLWLGANTRPRVNSDDSAMWRRILLVPFLRVIPEHERDPEVKHRLKTDPDAQAAILAWAVQGCLEWQQQGLGVPPQVRSYTAEYRAENDPLAEWIAECCVTGNGVKGYTADLRRSHEQWAERNGERPLKGKALGARFRARGFQDDKDRGGRFWRGISLREDGEQLAADTEQQLAADVDPSGRSGAGA